MKELNDLALQFADLLSRHDAGALRSLTAAEYLNHNPYVPQPANQESVIAFFEEWLRAFPDAEVICEDALGVGSIADGTVVGRFTYVGTFTTPILGIPPTGKRVVMRSIDIWRVRDGRFVEHWDELNTGDWFAQLQGADPQPRTGAAA